MSNMPTTVNILLILQKIIFNCAEHKSDCVSRSQTEWMAAGSQHPGPPQSHCHFLARWCVAIHQGDYRKQFSESHSRIHFQDRQQFRYYITGSPFHEVLLWRDCCLVRILILPANCTFATHKKELCVVVFLPLL